MSTPSDPPTLPQVARPISLIPVGLKEAALDSPSFRATAVHFAEHVDLLERWLEAYCRATSKLVSELSGFEEALHAFLARTVPPAYVSEAVLDHDYTLLAMRRFGEGSKEYWAQALASIRKLDETVLTPIRAYLGGESRNFRESRRNLDQTQKNYDNVLARYQGQSKSKEPSSLREDAFQVHEARRAYLKASLDFCLIAPQLRFTIDKLLVKISTDEWREMKRARDSTNNFVKWTGEIERVRGWSREMENSESIFRRELQIARREIAETVSAASKPSRELDDYSVYTIAYLGHKGPSAVTLAPDAALSSDKAEKQGWLFLRTIGGKPARTVWVRRWFFVKDGIYGWLVQGSQSGGVEESEKTGVLLCNVKPAVQEDRRFCFEVKTKTSSVMLQAETQAQLQEWLEAFDLAKSVALNATMNNTATTGDVDPAFAVTPPSVPELAARLTEGHVSQGSDDLALGDRVATLPPPDSSLAMRPSFDISATRRSLSPRDDGEGGRDHAARLMQKLDLHRRGTQSPQADALAAASGGIAGLISASHSLLPAAAASNPSALINLSGKDATSTLAPATLANPPAPTNLSKTALVASGDRGVRLGATPGGMMANVWGSTNWGYVNRLELVEGKDAASSPTDQPVPSASDQSAESAGGEEASAHPSPEPQTTTPTVSTNIDPAVETARSPPRHQKSVSLDAEAGRSVTQLSRVESFPSNYPLELKTQEAQFRMLFPEVPREDKLVLVFRATWNPNEQQEFPGRAYVTTKDLYFYSHHLGLVLTSKITLSTIDEVTAAPGKDCDFLFIHLRPEMNPRGYTRVTIKTFLEPLRLLQLRLNFLVDNARSNPPLGLERTVAELIKLEDEPMRSPSLESWEDVSLNTPADDGAVSARQAPRRDRDLKTTIHVERGLQLGRQRREVTKVQLPSQPIAYEPSDMQRKQVERNYDVSAKALFHVLFGDKSAVFQLLYHERRARNITQGPWIKLDPGHMRRDFTFQTEFTDMFRRKRLATVTDNQSIDIFNDHVCYVIDYHRTPWHLPHRKDFMLFSKIVITHVAKSKCKLAVYTKVEWSKSPTFSKALVENQALDDIGVDAMDLIDMVTDQVRKLGPHSQTKKAVHIFGRVGQQSSASIFSPTDLAYAKAQQITQRTLTRMVLDTAASFAESVASTLMMWVTAVVKHLWKAMTANTIILSLLVISAVTNVFFTSKDTSIWWTERNAAQFMRRIGVGPNPTMGRAVYVRDLDEVMTNATLDAVGQHDSSCFRSFEAITNLADLDSPFESAGATYSGISNKATARRLRRTRQSLGTYRHDLLVAMRVVNNVEREIIRAEWENFLHDETSRCQQLERVLESNPPGAQTFNLQPDSAGTNVDELRNWHHDYCGSCAVELEALQAKSSSVSLD